MQSHVRDCRTNFGGERLWLGLRGGCQPARSLTSPIFRRGPPSRFSRLRSRRKSYPKLHATPPARQSLAAPVWVTGILFGEPSEVGSIEDMVAALARRV